MRLKLESWSSSLAFLRPAFLLGHHELVLHVHVFHFEHRLFLRLHSETLAHLLERFFLLLELSSRFVHFRL